MSKELIRLRDLTMEFDGERILDGINLYINVYCKRRTSAPFLFRQERCPKEADSRGVESRAPARQSHPLENPQTALLMPLEHLNLKAVHHKNVPIFVMQRRY